MSTNRWIYLFLVCALAVAAALTIDGGIATSNLAHASGLGVCARPAVKFGTIHQQVDSQTGMVVIVSDAGPTGVDGGLLAILSGQPVCSN